MNNITLQVKHDFHPELIFDDFDDKSWLDKKHFKKSKNRQLMMD